MTRLVKSSLRAATAALLLFGPLDHSVHAFPDGAPPEHTGAHGQPSCKECHFGGMEAEPELRIEQLPGSGTGGLPIRITASHQHMKTLGLQLAAFSDQSVTLHCPEQLKGVAENGITYWTHTAPMASPKQSVNIVCQLTLPGPDARVLVGVAAVFSNDDLSPFGDDVMTRQLELKPGEMTSISD